MQPQSSSVIKIGGSLLSTRVFPSLIRALAPTLKKNKTVIVHGGGKEISSACTIAGIQPKFVHGRRFTDKKTMEIVEKILCGKVNPLLVRTLKKNGLRAVGSAVLGREFVQAKKIPALGSVGVPQKIRREKISALLQQGFLPVVASVASNQDGNALNVNADEMASAIAKALYAKRLILFTDVPGILDPSGNTISHVLLSNGKKLIAEGIVSSGMIPKLNSCLDALRAGVQEIWILEGKLPLSSAKGTVLTRNSKIVRHPFSFLTIVTLYSLLFTLY